MRMEVSMSRSARMATMLAMVVLLAACGISDHQKEALLNEVSTFILNAAAQGAPATVQARLLPQRASVASGAGLKIARRAADTRVRVLVSSNQKSACREAKKALALRLPKSDAQVVVVHFATDETTRSQPAI